MKIKRGDIFKIKCAPLEGVKAELVRQSATTGALTLELLEAKGAFKVGERVNVSQWDAEYLVSANSFYK